MPIEFSYPVFKFRLRSASLDIVSLLIQAGIDVGSTLVCVSDEDKKLKFTISPLEQLLTEASKKSIMSNLEKSKILKLTSPTILTPNSKNFNQKNGKRAHSPGKFSIKESWLQVASLLIDSGEIEYK